LCTNIGAVAGENLQTRWQLRNGKAERSVQLLREYRQIDCRKCPEGKRIHSCSIMSAIEQRAFIYKARFQNSLHVKNAEARYKNAGRMAEQMKQKKIDDNIKMQRNARQKKEDESSAQYFEVFGDTVKNARMTPEMLQLVSVKAANNRLANDMKKNKKQIDQIDAQLVKLNRALTKAQSDHHKEIKMTQGAGYPRKIEKLQRSVEQTKAKTSLKSLENNDFTSAINERRVALTNLRRALALARGEYQEKSSATHEMRLDTDADLYDIQDAEKRSAELSASIKALNKGFREQYEQKLEKFEKEYAKEAALEKKIEDLLLDSPTKAKSPNSSKGKKLPGGGFQKVQNRFFGKAHNKSRFLAAARQNRLDELKTRVTSMEDAFETMRQQTGIDSVEQLADMIIESDRQNFRVYNQLNDLNRDIEELEVANKGVRRTIRDIKVQRRARKSGKVVRVDRVKERLANTKSMLESTIKEVAEKKVLMANLSPGLGELFTILGCDQLSSGFDKGIVSERNVMALLGTIEQRIVDLANIVSRLQGFRDVRNTSGQFNNRGRGKSNLPESGTFSFFMTQEDGGSGGGVGRTSPLGSTRRPRELPSVDALTQMAEQEGLGRTKSPRRSGTAISPIISKKELLKEAVAIVEKQEANARAVALAIENAALENTESEESDEEDGGSAFRYDGGSRMVSPVTGSRRGKKNSPRRPTKSNIKNNQGRSGKGLNRSRGRNRRARVKLGSPT
jgi:hypothetical protein